MNNRTLGYAYLVLSMVTVGSTVVASKIAAASLPPFSATALRFALALPFLLVLVPVMKVRLPLLGRGDWLLLFVQACAGAIGYTALMMAGLQRTSATEAGIILGLLPLVAALFSVLALGERPTWRLWGALAVALAGVLLATGGTGDGGSWRGNLFVLAALGCEAVFILLNRRMRVAVPALWLSVLMTGLGLALSLLAALFEAPWRLQPDTAALWAVAYYALVPTVGGFLLWYAGCARVSAAEASLTTAIAPVAALLLAAPVLGEYVGPLQWTGVACVLAAVLFAGLSGRRAVVAAGG
ncbi:DMT family transporter [Pseudoduganella chitinolytica]|uniref:DMT family transporter n=1 Tax=Pseudoduganella chitinolytica TaxID=34070 RepID=A0ABY8BEF6_9BURK|nr:DMT family transporter [Pseudoduganella chitinolytica]WEF33097.1 DMT family transporter [Pseudoduganella chitinolytica]